MQAVQIPDDDLQCFSEATRLSCSAIAYHLAWEVDKCLRLVVAISNRPHARIHATLSPAQCTLRKSACRLHASIYHNRLQRL